MRYSKDRRIDAIVRLLVREGWTFRVNGHVRLTSPDGKRHLTAPRTPSDNRAYLNFRADARAVGVAV